MENARSVVLWLPWCPSIRLYIRVYRLKKVVIRAIARCPNHFYTFLPGLHTLWGVDMIQNEGLRGKNGIGIRFGTRWQVWVCQMGLNHLRTLVYPSHPNFPDKTDKKYMGWQKVHKVLIWAIWIGQGWPGRCVVIRDGCDQGLVYLELFENFVLRT